MTDVLQRSQTEPLSLRPGSRRTGEAISPMEVVPGLGTDLAATLDWAVRIGRDAPLPGRGETARLWAMLAEAARVDVGAARVLEPHLDALAILAQAGDAGIDAAAALGAVGADDEASWGVFAAEGPGVRLEATQDPGGAWSLNGVKPWCSLAGRLSHALVTAWVTPETRGLFAVPLRAPGVEAHDGPWVARGLSQIVSAPVGFRAVGAVPIGEPGWYLSRPGFAWGGIGVAAVWWGASIPLRDALVAAAGRDGADQLASYYAGAADSLLWAARAVLSESADAVDAGPGMSDGDMVTIASRARAATADAVERVLELADHALGPGPLTSDEDHARRVADLRIYIRQHHAERDIARLGQRVLR